MEVIVKSIFPTIFLKKSEKLAESYKRIPIVRNRTLNI